MPPVRTVFLCSFTVYQIPTVGSPPFLGAGNRGSQGRQDVSQQPVFQAHVTLAMDLLLFPFLLLSFLLICFLDFIQIAVRVAASLCSDSPTAWLVYNRIYIPFMTYKPLAQHSAHSKGPCCSNLIFSLPHKSTNPFPLESSLWVLILAPQEHPVPSTSLPILHSL